MTYDREQSQCGSGPNRALRRPNGQPRRRGFLLVAVMVCLFLVMTMAGSLVRAILLQRRQARAEVDQLQSFWVAESAYQRYRIRARLDPEFSGDTWKVTIDRQGRPAAGSATTRLVADSAAGRQQVEVTSIWPEESLYRSRYVKRAELPPSFGEQP